MSSRSDILARVRANLRVDPAAQAARRAAAERWLAARQPGPRPPLPETPEALAERFAARAQASASTLATVDTRDEVPAAVARYLAGLGLPRRAVCWPELAGLDWAGAGLSVAARPAGGDDAVGITGTFCAIAETGTLMLCSGPDTAAVTSLLPETHVAVVPWSTLVPAMEEGFTRLRAVSPDLPRAVNFVSGPSRTGDIEQTIVLGAHGPYRVHLILVRGA